MRLSPAMLHVLDAMRAGRWLQVWDNQEAYLTDNTHPKMVTVRALRRRGLVRPENKCDHIRLGRPLEGSKWRLWVLTKRGKGK